MKINIMEGKPSSSSSSSSRYHPYLNLRSKPPTSIDSQTQSQIEEFEQTLLKYKEQAERNKTHHSSSSSSEFDALSSQINEFEMVFQSVAQEQPFIMVTRARTGKPSPPINEDDEVIVVATVAAPPKRRGVPAYKKPTPPPPPPPPPIIEEDDKQCIVCLERDKTHILIPCGHYAYCEECSKNIKSCALCRKRISKRVKVFES